MTTLEYFWVAVVRNNYHGMMIILAWVAQVIVFAVLWKRLFKWASAAIAWVTRVLTIEDEPEEDKKQKPEQPK